MKTLKLFSLFLLALSLISCSNPASNDDDHDDHEHDAHGAVLKIDGQEIVRVEEGVVTSGEITVDEGAQSSLITIFFLAEDGDEFQPHEDEYELRWDITNTSVATISKDNSDSEWTFHVSGETAGSTEVVFTLWHSTAGHAALNTPEITIDVN